MNEEEIKKLVDDYFAKNAEALKSELQELQKAYAKRKLSEDREMVMRQQDDELFRALTELLKEPYKLAEPSPAPYGSPAAGSPSGEA